MKKIKVIEKALLPVGAQIRSLDDASGIRKWWRNRAVSKSQSNVRRLLEKYNIENTELLLLDNLALGLTDCYWVCPADVPLKWADVSLFRTAFASKLSVRLQLHDGLALEQRVSEAGQIGTFTPAASTGGELEKRWERLDGRIWLLKGNMPGNSYQQSLNEVFASTLHRTLGFINHVDYELVHLGKGSIGCMCQLPPP